MGELGIVWLIGDLGFWGGERAGEQAGYVYMEAAPRH